VARRASPWPERGLWRTPVALAASAFLSASTAVLLLSRHRVLAGVSALASCVALVAGSVHSDGDRDETDRDRRRADLAERILDLAFDASILVPLAWVLRGGSSRSAILAIVGLGAAYVASYERARGEALGYVGSESVAYRVTRESLVVLGLLTGWVTATLWAFTVIAVAAMSARAWNIVRQERHSRDSMGAR
jgi:hypothetical protein